MPITQIITYRATDGAEFATENQARAYEVDLLLRQFADTNNIADGTWTREQVFNALKTNRVQLTRILADALI